eukprot:TRINITY_DN3732_c0_g1_i1.p1 TRINITY_DN3732_c0_g1~~TRINITY_DN3732_c0_g1_i1.p1  ORF type:complete len:165 (+),score=51.47 TRINITY_DN3732_c0_g1_i1:31-525(+)
MLRTILKTSCKAVRVQSVNKPISLFLARKNYSTKAPENLKYLKSHEWVKIENGVGTIGISDYAQGALGDIVFVDLPDVGKKVHQSGTVGAVESVKSASDIYSPLSGEVLEVNENLKSTPDLVNKSPYTDGWMVKIKLTGGQSEVASLLDSKAYLKVVEEAAKDH